MLHLNASYFTHAFMQLIVLRYYAAIYCKFTCP